MMRRTVMFVCILMLLLIHAVYADVPPYDVARPDRLGIAICREGPDSETSREIVIFTRDPWWCEVVMINTTTTGLPYKWPDGPVIHHTYKPTDYWRQTFTVRVSSEDIQGNVWAAGNYTGEVLFTINYKKPDDKNTLVEIPVPVRLWIAECDDGPPAYEWVPEFPVLPGFSVSPICYGIIGAMLGIIVLIRREKS